MNCITNQDRYKIRKKYRKKQIDILNEVFHNFYALIVSLLIAVFH